MTRRVAGEVLLIPIRGNVADLASLYVLNETAALIWERIDGRAGSDEIAQSLQEVYDVPGDDAREDVADLLRSLTAAGLVHDAGGPASSEPSQ